MRDIAEVKFPCPVCGNEMKFNVPASDVRSVHITNADRIRSMTDEELAEFISGKGRTFGEKYEGYMSALDWLKEESE